MATSPTRYSVAGTAFRWPAIGASHATNRFFAIEFWFGTPDYEISDPRFFCASFWSPTTGGEVRIASGASISVQGVSVEGAPGVWTACPGAAEGGVLTVSDAVSGGWLPAVPVTLAANSLYRARMTFVVSSTGIMIPRHQYQALPASPGGQDKITGATSTRYAVLTDNSTITNSGGNGINYKPAMMVAKGGDGRPAIIVLGDSIGYGANDNAAPATWNRGNDFGYVARALDDDASSKRLGYHIMCIPGQSPAGNTKGWDSPTRWAGKIDAIDQLLVEYGEAPFDEVLSQHITNSIPYSDDGGNLRTGMDRYYDLVASLWGKPITQVECLPATSSSDGYATVANQTPVAGYDYGGAGTADLAWDFNADVGGTDGLGDPAAYYRASGRIIASIAPWRTVAADTASNRDKYPVRAFATTLASAYASGTTISTVAAPVLGEQIVVERDSGTYSVARDVTAVAGSGPYTVTLNGQLGGAAGIGRAARAAWGDSIHPGGPLHRDVLPQTIIDWKIARGWVEGAEITGTLSATEPADTAALAGDVIVSGALAAVEPADTAAFTGDAIIAGALAAIEPADVAALAGSPIIQGGLAAMEPGDTASLSGDVIVQGALAATEAPDAVTIQGEGVVAVVSGTLAATEGQDIAALAGSPVIAGALAATEPADLAAFSGGLVTEVTGSLAAVEAPDTFALHGLVLIQGGLAATEAADVVRIVGVSQVRRVPTTSISITYSHTSRPRQISTGRR